MTMEKRALLYLWLGAIHKVRTHQGSAILSESVRNRDTKGPGIGIGIEFCTSLGLSIGLGIEFFYFWVPHSINWDISSYFTL